MNWHTRIHTDLAAQAAKQAYRRRAPRRADVPLPEIDFDDTRLLNFGGNDYLGLSRDESVIAAWQRALSRFGSGSGGSPLVSGHTDAHEALEQLLAGWLGYERALVFASGYAANQAVLLGLLGKNDVLLADKYCHASMQEAAALSPAAFRRFAHQQYHQLAALLPQYAGRCTLVASW